MVVGYVRCIVFVIILLENVLFNDGQFPERMDYENMSPLPFPMCRADNIDCLRRSLRTFFYLMDAGSFGMKPVDPVILNSITLAMPEKQVTFVLRRVNVTGARWTKLAERRFNLEGSKNGIIFLNDLHVIGQLSMEMHTNLEPLIAFLTMDIQSVETNITYPWSIQRGLDKEEYIVIGPERVAVRNKNTPAFFTQPNSQDAYTIEEFLELHPSILDHFANEITAAIMHYIVDNFRLFASKVPLRHYYKYY